MYCQARPEMVVSSSFGVQAMARRCVASPATLPSRYELAIRATYGTLVADLVLGHIGADLFHDTDNLVPGNLHSKNR
jgi:hypothetical protein